MYYTNRVSQEWVGRGWAEFQTQVPEMARKGVELGNL